MYFDGDPRCKYLNGCKNEIKAGSRVIPIKVSKTGEMTGALDIMPHSISGEFDFERICGCDEGFWFEKSESGAAKLFMLFSIISLTGQIIYLV